MKLKNILRVFCVMIFILGAPTMNAQNKFYVYNGDGSTKEYKFADVDSIGFTKPVIQEPGKNLLVNPGFEIEDDATDALPGPWIAVPENWFTSYYTGFTTTTHTSGNRASGDFFVTGNGRLIPNVRTGDYAGRLLLAATSGIYQLVNVTPGKKYCFSVNIAITTTGTAQVIKDNETVKILSPDGMTTYLAVPIPQTGGTIMTITGTLTIPAGVTQVRFQLDQRDYAAAPGGPGRAPLTLFDECEFREGNCDPVVNPDFSLPIRDITAKYYTPGGVPALYVGCTPGTLAPAANNKDVNNEFSYIVPGNAFKQTQIHSNPTSWNWSNTDPWIPAARNNKQVIRMHGPISPQCSQWAKNSSRTPAELEQNMREYMTALCERYNKESDVIKWMDVINETMKATGEWFHDPKSDPSSYQNPWPKIGYDKSPAALLVDSKEGVPLYIGYAFEIATSKAPNIKLIINQHNGVEQAVINKMQKLVKYLRDKGYRVDGIGWQAHVKPGWEKTAANLTRLSSYIDWCHANNLEFHITELNQHAETDQERTTEVDKQADTFLAITRMVVQKRKTGFVAINFWNMKSCGTSDSGKPICAPWACNGTPLPAAIRIKQMLVEEAGK